MDKEVIKPYFPYGIRVVANNTCKESFKIKELFEDFCRVEDEWKNGFTIPYASKAYKILLHPITMEEMHKPLRVNSKLMIVSDYLGKIIHENITDLLPPVHSDWLVELIVNYFNDTKICPFSQIVMSKLCSVLYALHFDMFGYIEKGIARNICEMEYNPYDYDPILL